MITRLERWPIDLARGADDVEHAAALVLADEVAVDARRAEALVVGAHDGVAGLEPAGERIDVRDVRSERRSREGAQLSAMPVVPCAHVRIGQPPFGALPFGTVIVPLTASGLPAASVER